MFPHFGICPALFGAATCHPSLTTWWLSPDNLPEGRGAEALITIDTPLEHPFSVPVVAVAGHRPIPGVTNVILDHRFAAELVLTHLHSLGHRRIVLFLEQITVEPQLVVRGVHAGDSTEESGGYG